jgi:hypothetical protein
MAAATETRAAESGSAFSWRFVTPLFIGSALCSRELTIAHRSVS